jgi:hypothetical protein
MKSLNINCSFIILLFFFRNILKLLLFLIWKLNNMKCVEKNTGFVEFDFLNINTNSSKEGSIKVDLLNNFEIWQSSAVNVDLFISLSIWIEVSDNFVYFVNDKYNCNVEWANFSKINKLSYKTMHKFDTFEKFALTLLYLKAQLSWIQVISLWLWNKW